MRKNSISLCKAGFVVLSVACIAGLPARAGSDKLLKMLEDKNIISSSEAAEIKASEAKYTVRPSKKVVKDLQIRGRIHAQFGYVDAKNDNSIVDEDGKETDTSGDYTTFEMRRVRMGMRGTFFDKFRAQLEANLVPGSDLSMRSAFIQWREYKPAYIKLGYDKPHSSIEEQTSSAAILTVERSLINNTVAAPGPTTGLSIDGTLPMIVYGAGIYTDQNNRNKDGAGKYMYNAMAGLKLDDMLGDKSKLLIQGVYTKSDDPDGKVGAKFDDVITAGASFGMGRFDLRGEYMVGDNDGSKIKGWYVMPAVHLTEKLQAVARFEQAKADKDGGLSAPSRYMRKVDFVSEEKGLQKGNEYQAAYLGLNHYFSGQAHKIMLGVEMAELKNTEGGKLKGTTVYTAWRMLF